MTLVPAPRDICEKVSTRAVQHAREDIGSRGWSDNAVQAITSFPGEGQVGLRTTAKYLLYQERGIRPFVMWWVEGRTVPIKGRGGGPTRFVRGVGPGTPGWVTLPGGVRKWREQRWRHPGLKPKHFMQDALLRAIRESQPDLQKMLMGSLKGATLA